MTQSYSLPVDGCEEGEWLAGFYQGRRDAMEVLYRQHFATVDAAVAGVLRGPDRETVVQEVFARLMADAELRAAFRGGRMTAWLWRVSRNLALDFARHRDYESPLGLTPGAEGARAEDAIERSAEVRLFVDRFRKEGLPPRWWSVFEARFMMQMDQASAARHVGISRTTLAYREIRIRALLRRFALGSEAP